MGYSAESQFLVGTNLFNIVQKANDTKTVEVKDEWTNKVIGTKQLFKNYYVFDGEKYDDIYDIEMKLKELGLKIFYTNLDSSDAVFVGIGTSTTYKNNVISTYIDKIKEDIDTVKPILEKLGYIGEIGIYSILYESY
jgi:hypothetical protein